MNKIKKYFEKTNTGAILIIAFLLLCLYGYTISSFLASPPSQGFSREIEIGQVASGEQININSHVETIELSNEETLVAAVDGHQYKLIRISSMGDVLEEDLVDLDLFYATEISASIDHEGELTLFYVDDNLYQVKIDLDTMEYNRLTVAEDVDDFIRQGHIIVFQQISGLYGVDITDFTRILPLVQGQIRSFALEIDDITGVYHLLTTIKNIISVDIRYIQFNDLLTIENEFLLRENTGSSYLKYIRDIYVNENTLTAAYVWQDEKRGENNVTIHQYDTRTGELFTDYLQEFSFHKSRYIIKDVDQDRVKMIFQETVHYGVNIAEVLIFPDQEPLITPLTKTKKLSKISKVYTLGEEQALVFFDLIEGDKKLYFASSNSELIKETTKVTTIDPVRIIGVIFIVIFQAAFTGAVVYILFVALAPLLLLLLMDKFLPSFKNKSYIQSAISVVIHTGLKIYLTYQLIYVMATFVLRPQIVGEEPYIYIAMVVMSAISYYLMSRYIKWNIEYSSTPLLAYLQFILFEYVSYTLLVYIYITTYLVINKI